MRASKDLMECLHALLADRFTDALNSEEVSPATLAAAAKFLKDNGVYGFDISDKKLNDLADRITDMIGKDDGLSEATGRNFSA